MGADFIGYILAMPEKIDYKAGSEFLHSLKQDALVCLDCIKAITDNEDGAASLEEIFDDTKCQPAENYLRAVAPDCFDDPEDCRAVLSDLVEWCGDCSENRVDDLMLLDGRDLICRGINIKGESWIIYCAGDNTWGDEPAGIGYLSMKMAIETGLAHAVGCK